MTTAELILCACGIVGVLITAAGWFVSVGRQGQKIATLTEQVAEHTHELALRATAADLAALIKRTEEVEHNMREIDQVKSMVERLSQTIAHQSEVSALNQSLVVQKIDAGNALTASQLDDLRHKVRDISQGLLSEPRSFEPAR